VAPDRRLPAESTTFVGRKRELAETKALLSAARMVTLTGTGGVGKTRLALRAAEQARRGFPDGVCLVELASVPSPDLVAGTVATAFGLRDAADDPAAALGKFLRAKRLLLVLDNCEHVVESCANLVGGVLDAAPGVRVLATSRTPLGVPGEHVSRVRPLEVPEVDGPGAAAELDAVVLFADRAAAASGFRVDQSNWDVVVQLCRRLDGIPLAIELAVVWLRVLALEQVLTRLDDRFRLLVRGSQAAPTRQQTLAGAIEWSYQLCSPAERLLWDRLSVFADGFDVDAAIAVCSGDGIERSEVPSLADGLVEHSILAFDGARYRMLETIRQYGRDRLRAADVETSSRARHRDHYLAFAERGERDWLLGTEQLAVYTRTRAEQANLRAALEFCLTTPGEAAAGLRLGVALPYHWLFSGWIAEGRYWLGRALEQNPEPSRDRATALWISAYASCLMGFYHDGLPFARESEEWARRHGDEVVLGYARLALGGCAFLGGDFDRATALFQDIADRQHRSGHYTSALFLSYLTVGQSEVWGGRPSMGLEVAWQALELCEETGEHWARTHLYYCLGLGYWKLRDWPSAEEALRRGLRIAEAFHDIIAVAQQLEILTAVVAAAGRYERAAELLGVGAKVWPFAGGEPYLSFQAMIDTHDASERVVGAALGAEYDVVFARGAAEASTLESAVAFVLGDRPAASRPALTEREHEVAELVARGLTNREIAARLVISPRTAETHVNRVMGKLGVTSRTRLAARLAEVGVDHRADHDK
jgi:predicted ATPase/DNA-binding CsgD family transcriptional regulator